MLRPGSTAVRRIGGGPSIPSPDRLQASGKFFVADGKKVILKGVTYGPFAPDANGCQFPAATQVDRDLSILSDLGANALRTFTLPPQWLLDLAASRGFRVLAGIPWTEHVCFLDSRSVTAEIRRTVAAAVEACREHPAIGAYLVGNEIPPDIVRWHGAPRVAAFVRELTDLVKDIDPSCLVGYANFPSTEYLETPFTDFLAFNVYLHREYDLRRYLYRLHALAGDRPLVLTEIGVDSMREGTAGQATILSRQVRTALEMGVAGTTIFSFTDEWYTGGTDVADWAFGLVDRERRPKSAFRAVQRWYANGLPPLSEYPKVSVVVCAYNAESTMDACLTSLQALRYPAYEIVVVDDGSTDDTGRIADRYEGVHVVHQPNMGLSAARNVGLRASTGEIIAYTDSDCVVDPDWLHYLVATFLSSGVSAVGGPNLPPPEDSLVASCVAAAPGGPLPVLLNDREAEHVPGCNMAFWRGALEDAGGFDPIFRAAGDDVDICWRLERRGHLIGWSPAAMVWHFRRNTVRAYIGQQKGYGKAEALLYLRHPDRFNSLGYSRWRGRVYGGISAVLSWRRSVIYGGVFGRGLFQTLYQQPASSWAYLPFTLEWNAVAAILLIGALLHGGFAWLFATPLALSWAGCVGGALRARVDARAGSARGRLLIAVLTYLGPVLRSLERYRWWARGLTAAAAAPGHQEAASRLGWDRAFTTSFWTSEGLDKESILDGLTTAITSRGHLVAVDQGWSQWDLEVHGGLWSRARLKVATEYHGGDRRVLRVKCALRASPLARLIVVGAVAGIGAGALLDVNLLLAVGIGAAACGLGRYFLERLRVRRTVDTALCAVKSNLRLHEVSAESP